MDRKHNRGKKLKAFEIWSFNLKSPYTRKPFTRLFRLRREKKIYSSNETKDRPPGWGDVSEFELDTEH